MIHYYPLGRSIVMFVIGVIGVVLNIILLKFAMIFSFLLGIMALIAIYIGITGISKRKKEPMIFENNLLKFYKRGKLIEVNREGIKKIFYNTKGIDKRVTILTMDGREIDIPTVYGLNPLVKKLNQNLKLGQAMG